MMFMSQPKEFQIGTKVCKLKRSLYGLHQSGREWYRELKQIFKELELEAFDYGNCIYFKRENIVILVYVDDMAIFGKTRKIIEEIISLIESKIKIKRIGPISRLLGVNFVNSEHITGIHQKDYIENLQKLFPTIPNLYASLPMQPGFKTKDKNKPIANNSNYPYRSLIGSLYFIASRTRPDVMIMQ